jgi:hypothetical protein
MTVDLGEIMREACREGFRDPAVIRALRDASEDVWLTLDEAAAIAKVAPRVLRDAGRAGKLVLGSAGSEPRCTRRDLDRWLATAPLKKPRKARPRAEECRDAANDNTTTATDARAAGRLAAARAAKKIGSTK